MFFEKNNFKFPVWIEDENRKKWKNYSDINRVAFYVYIELQKIFKNKDDVVISFENFINNPEFEINKLKNIFKIEFNKTFLHLKNNIIKKNKTNKNTKDLIEKDLIEKNLKVKIDILYKKIKIKYKL